jgi:hypothetical protein
MIPKRVRDSNKLIIEPCCFRIRFQIFDVQAIPVIRVQFLHRQTTSQSRAFHTALTLTSRLLPVITSLSLRKRRCLSGLVLCDLVELMLAALLALAICATSLGNVDHGEREAQ